MHRAEHAAHPSRRIDDRDLPFTAATPHERIGGRQAGEPGTDHQGMRPLLVGHGCLQFSGNRRS
jgi:hypothetical protein